MNRRGFIGSVIGLCMTSRLPLIAQEPVLAPVKTKEDIRIWKMKEGIKIFEVPDEILMRYSGIVDAEEGTFLAANLIRVERTMENLTCSFHFDDVKVNRTMTVHAITLINPEKQAVMSQRYFANIHMVVGDILKTTYTINLNSPT